MKLYYQNARGIKSKLHKLFINLSELVYDVIIITKNVVVLNDSVYDSEIFPAFYEVRFRCDRRFSDLGRQKGSGVLIAISTDYSIEMVDASSVTTIV